MRLPRPESERRAAGATETTVTLFGAGLFAVLPLSTDIYLPAMVEIGREFGTSLAGVQATMAAFTAGFALSHLFIGNLADRLGRRPVALCGLALFLAASVLGALAPSLPLLIGARCLQGCAAATGPILARAVVRDVVTPARAGRALALMGALVGVAPVVAPLAGGLAASLFGWRATLWFLAAYAVGLLALVALRFPETLVRTAQGRARPSPFKVLGLLFAERAFVIGTLALAAGYGALFTWLSTSPFLLMADLGLSRLEAALLYGCGSLGFVAGGLLSARLSRRLRSGEILFIAGTLAVLGSGACFSLVSAGSPGWAAVLIAMLPFYVGWGAAQPQAIALAMQPFPAMAGQASAWLGVVQQIGGIAFSLAAVRLGGGVASLAVMIVAALCLTGLAALTRRR